MKKRVKVLFICLGNICRSPAAEGIFKSFAEKEGLADRFEVDSAGMHGYHQGERADARMRECASRRGYDLTSRSRPFNSDDYERFDYIIGMDNSNIADLKRRVPAEYHYKISKMSDYCIEHAADSIPDPYYGGLSGFDHVLDLLEDASAQLLKKLR